MTFDAIMNAEMKRRWPDEPRAAGKRALRRERRRSSYGGIEAGAMEGVCNEGGKSEGRGDRSGPVWH